MEGYMTAMEAAALLGLSDARVRVLLNTAVLAGEKIGRDWLVEVDSVNLYQNEGRDIPAGLRTRVLLRDKATCQDCGFQTGDGTGLHVHHIKERAEGGGDNMANLVALCPDCHLKRHGQVRGRVYQSKTYSLSDEVIARLEALRTKYGSVNKGLLIALSSEPVPVGIDEPFSREERDEARRLADVAKAVSPRKKTKKALAAEALKASDPKASEYGRGLADVVEVQRQGNELQELAKKHLHDAAQIPERDRDLDAVGPEASSGRGKATVQTFRRGMREKGSKR